VIAWAFPIRHDVYTSNGNVPSFPLHGPSQRAERKDTCGEVDSQTLLICYRRDPQVIIAYYATLSTRNRLLRPPRGEIARCLHGCKTVTIAISCQQTFSHDKSSSNICNHSPLFDVFIRSPRIAERQLCHAALNDLSRWGNIQMHVLRQAQSLLTQA
jgi:hypothetical protein